MIQTGFIMLLDANKDAVRRMFEAINDKDLGSMDDLMLDDFILHIRTEELLGWAASKDFLRGEFRTFPDLHVEILEMVGEGDIVSVRLKETATYLGEYQGHVPTGRKVSYTVAAFWRVADGKIAEGWPVYDRLDLLAQMGIVKNNE